MKIRKGDKVLITTGDDKGETGEVLRGYPKDNKVLVEGINKKTKSKRPEKEGESGQLVEINYPVPVSNVKLICPNCDKATRVGYETKKRKKYRVCKKCNQAV